MRQSSPFSTLARARYVSLTTYRRTGERVSTPVWIAPSRDGEALYVLTMLNAGRLKRIRHTPQATLAPCGMKGKVKGPAFPAIARLLPPADHAMANRTITRKYRLQKLALDLYHWWTHSPRTFMELRLTEAEDRSVEAAG